jgi:hypothetical protein
MYLVIGNIPRGVELKDLKDFIYYKQQKVYTEVQYDSSRDLQREIKSGSLTILKKTDDKSGSFDIPSFGLTNPSPAAPVVADDSKMDTILERIDNLERTISSRESVPAQVIERTVGDSPHAEIIQELADSVRKLEEKIDSRSSNSEIFDRLEDIINRAPGGAAKEQSQEPMTPEEIYVPNVIVEDGHSHIKLDVRTIDSGDSVSDSLKKLRELKSKST